MWNKSQDMIVQKPIIAATGLDGLVGSRIREVLQEKYDFVNLKEGVIDITSAESVQKCVHETQFDVFLHLAAFTNVDSAESERETAWKVNVDGTRNVFDAVRTKGAKGKKSAKFIYISTGFVFDGLSGPYYEDSIPHPVCYYGETKLEGEKIVGLDGMIVRIDYPYGGHVGYKKDIVENLIDNLREKKPLSGVVDQILTPTYIDDIANALDYLIEHYSPEIYHIVGADNLSGMDVINTIGRVFDLDTSYVQEITFDEFNKGKAIRPKQSIMKSRKNDFYVMSAFEQGLEKLKSRLTT